MFIHEMTVDDVLARLCLKSRCWTGSVPSVVADGLPSRNAKLLLIMNTIASPIRYRGRY
jgi:hypothetical protein